MAINSITFSATAQSGDKLNKSVTDINANAAGTVLHEFARRANALTTNTLGSVNRVSKVSLDDEKLTPTLSLATTSASYSVVENALKSAPYHYVIDISFVGDGELDWACSTNSDNVNLMTGKIVKNGDAYQLWIGYFGAPYFHPGSTFTVTASETVNYHAASATFTITD